MPITVLFKKKKPTKNTIQYEEVPEKGQDTVIGSLYLKKGLAESLGDEVKVTVTQA